MPMMTNKRIDALSTARRLLTSARAPGIGDGIQNMAAELIKAQEELDQIAAALALAKADPKRFMREFEEQRDAALKEVTG